MKRADRFLRLLLAVIDTGKWLVPAARRREWHRQWRADVWHEWMWLSRRGPRAIDRARLAHRTAGALRHAVWLRMNHKALDMITHDLRYGWRLMLRRPAFTAIAILTLGLGIGANVTIYSWVEALLLRPMPVVPHADRFAALSTTTRTRTGLSVSWPNFVDMRAGRPASVDDFLAYALVPMNLRTSGEPERVWGQLVSGNYFDVLGLTLPLGRGFTPEEDRVPDARPVVVFSQAYWTRHFASDPAIVGRNVVLNGRAFTVIGIAPEGFRGTAAGLGADVFVPMMMQKAVMPGDRLEQRGNSWLLAMAKLKPGVSIARAQADLDVVARNLAAAYPDDADRGIRVDPLWRAPGASQLLLPILTVLMGVVGLVLLIACANVASLLLASASGRQRETAVRLALGASRTRIVRQLLTESALLAAGGGAAGVVIAYWTADLLKLFVPQVGLPIALDVPLSAPVVLFAVGVTLASTVVFGLVPAWQGSATSLVPALKETAGQVSPGARRARLRQGLVVAQVALSLMLLVSAGLFVRTLYNAQNMDPGFSTRSGLFASLDLLPAGYDEVRGTALFRNLLTRVREVPGGEAASMGQRVPLNLGGGSDMGVRVDGYTPTPNEELTVFYNRVGSDYLRALGVSLVSGRDLTDRDTPDSPKVAIINETMARRYWRGRDPIGGRIHISIATKPAIVEVVGVARDGKYSTLTEAPRSFMYLPVQQWYRPDTVLTIKTSGDPAAAAASVQRAVRQLDPNLPLFEVRTIEEHLDFALFVQRMSASLLGAFGILALFLAMIGLYGVIAAGVAQRTPEIGMRMALGADRSDILALVLKQGLAVTAIGILIGIVGAAGLTRLFKSQLVGVGAMDAMSYAATTMLLIAVAFVATYLPARHAASVDPLAALRND
jgi:macrolide transport system ATP-binding/permease protein